MSVPLTVDTKVGAHTYSAVLDAQARARADINPHDVTRCAQPDVMAVVVTRDNQPIFTKGYCSGMNWTWARFHVDAKGVPYLFVAWKEFSTRGWNNSLEAVNIYSLGRKPGVRGGFDIADAVGYDERCGFRYQVTTPEKGGLIVEVEAHNPGPPDGRCDHLPVYQKFRFGPDE